VSKPKPILISIPHPCTQNRDEMTRTTEGRFCAHCQKTVIDFTTWTDTALYNFFSKNTGKVCGTFYQDQLNRPINIPYQPNSRLYRLTIALGLTLIFTQTPNAFAQNNPPKTEQTSILKQQADLNDHPGEIGGRVLSEKKEPFQGATIQVFLNNTLIGSTKTDIDGNYTFKPLTPGYYNLFIAHSLYFTIEIQDVIVSPGSRTTQNAILTLKGVNDSQKVKVIQYRKPLVDGGISADRLLSPPEFQKITESKSYKIDSVMTRGTRPGLSDSDSSETVPLIDIDKPDKRTFTHDDINHIPH